MGAVIRIVLLAVLGLVAFKVVGWALGLLVGVVLLGVKVAVAAALVLALVWAFRRVSPRSRRRAELGSGSADWAYIRGRIDKETYMRRRSLGR